MNGCVHHWRIEEANGPESRGTCKKCGMTRQFLNGADYWEFNNAKNEISFTDKERRYV